MIELGDCNAGGRVTPSDALSPAQVREIPDGWVLLLYHNLPPVMLGAPLAAKRAATRRHLGPWSLAEAQLERAIEVPAPEPAP